MAKIYSYAYFLGIYAMLFPRLTLAVQRYLKLCVLIKERHEMRKIYLKLQMTYRSYKIVRQIVNPGVVIN